ncbi:hypothetical protein CDAR_517371 [Caerostris darwini]|uniref:Uncharacterized protein n=1 Tax=Caerostris darwini TaxID=1538125 RepID=A0AAV4SQE7_9ARAC|nr:hypothetical protein CDAR_517371 [Caerostris darwini]
MPEAAVYLADIREWGPNNSVQGCLRTEASTIRILCVLVLRLDFLPSTTIYHCSRFLIHSFTRASGLSLKWEIQQHKRGVSVYLLAVCASGVVLELCNGPFWTATSASRGHPSHLCGSGL